MTKIGIETLLPGDYYETEFEGTIYDFLEEIRNEDFIEIRKGLFIQLKHIVSIYQVTSN